MSRIVEGAIILLLLTVTACASVGITKIASSIIVQITYR